jgi:hypothetical protein
VPFNFTHAVIFLPQLDDKRMDFGLGCAHALPALTKCESETGRYARSFEQTLRTVRSQSAGYISDAGVVASVGRLSDRLAIDFFDVKLGRCHES